MHVPVVPATPDLADAARALATTWGLPFEPASEERYRLILTPERLELRQSGPDAAGPVYVDFVGGAVGHRRRFGGGRGQPIARAVGMKKGELPRILDATAGLGRDAFVFASLGSVVTMIERSPVVAALLADGLRRAAADPEIGPWVGERMRLLQGDAVATLAAIGESERPDVVYLDPMYPPREKSALVKKEMRYFHEVVGPDPDADRLLPAALRAARKRVVVKRPKYAEPLAGRRPTMSIDTERHRFDVYVIGAIPSE